MKSKFEEFNDGIVKMYIEDENGLLVAKTDLELRFGEENVSIQRHYAAQAADTHVDRMIHVPLRREIQPHDIAVIGEDQFDIDKVDHITDNMPPITKLSLVMLEKHRRKEFA